MGFVSNLQDLVRSFNWHSPSWDLFILLFWIVASVIYAFSAGRGRILTILVSIYMSQLLTKELPFMSALSEKVNIQTGSLQQLAVFVVLFVIIFIFLGRYAFKSSVDGKQFSAVGFSVVFSILQVGLLINIILNYLPDQVINSFSPLITFIFLHQYSNFVWLALPVLFLIILGRFISDRSEM